MNISNLFKRILLMLAVAIVIVWLYPHPQSHQFIYEEGRPWNYTQLIAPFDIPIHPDSAALRQAKDTLDSNFVPIYRVNKGMVDSVIALLPDGESADQKRKVSALIRAAYEKGVIETTTMSQIRSGDLQRLRILEKNILSERSTAGLTSPRDIYLYLDSAITDPALHSYFAGANLHNILRANILFDPVENKRHYDNEYQTLTADRGVIMQGQAIINKGDIISGQDFTNLRTYEAMIDARLTHSNQSSLLMLLGQFLYVAGILALLAGYLAIIEPVIWARMRSMAFILSLVLVFFLFALGLNSFIPGGVYIVPLAIVPILTLVFFNGRTALFTSVVTVMLIAPITSFALEFIYLQVCASCVAVYSLRELSRRSQLLRTAFFVAIAYIVAYVSLELLMNGSLDGFTWRMPVFLASNALLVSMAYIIMFAAERVFGFVSVVTLVELADTNQPLLRQLSEKCPGTFQHAMSVSNLASDAARAMGANETLVRAGALYHDIGKMANPAFFTENQHGVNPHDTLTPEQSARILISHVTDGLKMAEKARLPKSVRDFISEHHGAGKAKYFYYKACNASPDAPVDPTPFTYPGPNPRSRETSLLMMADAVEAASRSLTDYSRKSISELVDKIIDGQIADGLHSDSPLEFRDVQLIKAAFIKRLSTMYHTRIAYPPAPAGTEQSDDAKNEKPQ